MDRLVQKSRPNLMDAMIVVAAIAVSWSLPMTMTVTSSNVRFCWDSGFWETFLWWAILGPTLAGPLLAWRHRREGMSWSSGTSLWLGLCFLKLIQIVLFYTTYGGRFRALLRYAEFVAELGVPIALAICLARRGWRDRPWLDMTGLILGFAWVVYFERNFYSRNFSVNNSWNVM